MSNKKMDKLIFIILFFLVNRIVYGQFIPEPHMGSKAVFVGNRIYYIGGIDYDVSDTTSDVFYFDNGAELSSTGLLQFVDLKNQATFPYVGFHVAGEGGVNQDLIFISGGYQLTANSPNVVYQLDTKTNTVTTPIIQGTNPPRREDMDSVSYQGKIYMFGGRVFANGVDTHFGRFDILDTINLSWEVGTLVNAPLPRIYYTATLVNGVIYYIGGIAGEAGKTGKRGFVDMSEVCNKAFN
jgi:hypothetical protein